MYRFSSKAGKQKYGGQKQRASILSSCLSPRHPEPPPLTFLNRLLPAYPVSLQRSRSRSHLLATERESNAAAYQWRRKRRRASVTKKLEDYLDPILLSQTCAEIGHSNTGTEAAVKLKREARDFDWPDDELKVFMEEVPPRYEKKRAKGENNEESGDGAVEFCTPFKRLEETAWKRFEVVKDDENRSI